MPIPNMVKATGNDNSRYLRRWEQLWSAMESDRLAALLLTGRGYLSEYGFIQYTTGFHPGHRHSYVVMRPGEAPVLILPHSDRAAVQPDVAAGVVVRWEPDAIAAITTALGGVGIAGVAGLTKQFPRSAEAAIRASCTGKVVDGELLMREVKIVKSAEDVASLTRSSELAMRAIDIGAKQVHPGMTHRELARRFDNAARTEGADLTVILVGAGAISGQPPTSALVGDEDCLSVFVEVSVDGYWVEHSTILNFTQSQGPEHQNASIALELLQRAASTMVIGNRASDVAASLDTEFQRAGVKPTMGLGHGVGVDEDSPIIDAKDRTLIRENMVIALHPSFINSDGKGFAVADTFHVGIDGATPLVPPGPRTINVSGVAR